MSNRIPPLFSFALLASCSAIVSPDRSRLESPDGAVVCSRDLDCDDGLACNGVERCVAATPNASSRCVAGTARTCDDGMSCTRDVCRDPDGACMYEPSDASCDDDVSCTVDACIPNAPERDPDGCVHSPNDAHCDDGFCFQGGTCDPTAGCIGAVPRVCEDDGSPCTSDFCDAERSTCVHRPVDDDHDGASALRVGTAFCPRGNDCDDSNPGVGPHIAEVCGNRQDDDCNGVIDEGCPGGNDTCATALPLVPGPDGRVSFSGRLADYADEYRDPICSNAGGRDAVFYFTLSAISDVTIDTFGSAGDVTLSLQRSCGTNFLCNDDADRGIGVPAARIWLHRMGPGFGEPPQTFFVIVDGYNEAMRSEFRLNVLVQPAREDECGRGPLDISGGGLVVGRVEGGRTLSPGGICETAIAAGEAIFRFSVPDDGVVDRLVARSPDFRPTLYVQTECNSRELACEQASLITSGSYQARIDRDLVSGNPHAFIGDVPEGLHSYTLEYDP